MSYRPHSGPALSPLPSFPSFFYHDLRYHPSFYGSWSPTCMLIKEKVQIYNIGRKKIHFSSAGCLPPPSLPLGSSAPPRPLLLAGAAGRASPGAGAEAPPGGVGTGAPRSPHTRTRQSHGLARAAAGGIEDGGLRRPQRVCPAPAPAAAVPNLRYTCELASCPWAPAPRANRPSAALHPKCGI